MADPNHLPGFLDVLKALRGHATPGVASNARRTTTAIASLLAVWKREHRTDTEARSLHAQVSPAEQFVLDEEATADAGRVASALARCAEKYEHAALDIDRDDTAQATARKKQRPPP